MSTSEPQAGASPGAETGAGSRGIDPNEQGPKKRRNPWIWVSVGVAVVAVALLIWGLNNQSDADSAQKDVKDLESQVSHGRVAGTAVAASSKAAYDDLQQELGTTSTDLSQTEQDLHDAENATTKAEQDAAAAKKDADQAQNQTDTAKTETDKAKAETDKAKAEAKEANAESEATKSKSAIVADCAKSYLSAFGKLFEGESVKEQASVVKQDLEGISKTCKSALGSA